MIRVLVVDDALFMRKVYTGMLERNGMAVAAEAANGFEAITNYELHHPDVVVMDITMPGMTGLEALEQIRKIDPAAKVIMVSAMGQEEFVRRSVRMGAKAFVVKPVVEQRLIDTINGVMEA